MLFSCAVCDISYFAPFYFDSPRWMYRDDTVASFLVCSKITKY